MSDYFKNFGMFIPKDICRFASGTPMIVSSQIDKEDFTKWCDLNMPIIHTLSKEEIQGVFKYWKQINKSNEK